MDRVVYICMVGSIDEELAQGVVPLARWRCQLHRLRRCDKRRARPWRPSDWNGGGRLQP